ncbi:MAG: type II secretion system F family protein, partial [Candidatus Nitrosotenuis sp.]
MSHAKIFIFVTLAAMWTFIYLQNVTAFLVLAFIVVIFIMIEEKGKMLGLFSLIYRVKNKTRFLHQLAPHAQLKIVRPANSTIIALLKPITEQKALAQIQMRLDSNLASQISHSGKAANPKTLAQKTMAYTVFTLLITFPMSIILGLWFNIMFFSLLAAPLFVFALPSMKLKWNQVERKSAIDDELSFFAVYCSVMQSVGKPIYDAILQSVGKRIFPIIESEGRMLERNVSLFGMDHLEAINTLALQHPNTAFRNLLLGYVSIQKSGGDLTRYLESKSQEFFSQTKFKFFKYASSAENIAEILLILLNILPILLIMSSFLMSHESVRIIVSLSFVAVPAITAALLIFVIGIQPKTHNIVAASMRPIPVAIASGLVAFF